MLKLFWHLAPHQPNDEGFTFEIEKVEKITSCPHHLDIKIYRAMLKGCIAQTKLELLPAVLRGAEALEEYELAAYIKIRIENLKKFAPD